MWNTFEINDKYFMIKTNVCDGLLLVHLTDLENIYEETLANDLLLKRFQEINPLLDIKANDIAIEIENLVNAIDDNNETNKSETEIIESNENCVELKIKSESAGFGVEFKFNFTKASSETVNNLQFLKEVTVPLVFAAKSFAEQQEMLCNLIEKKDRELAEYKLEQGEITRRDLVTEKFDETFVNGKDNKQVMNLFKNGEFWKKFLQKRGYNSVEMPKIRKDPWNNIVRKRKVYSSKNVLKKNAGVTYNKPSN